VNIVFMPSYDVIISRFLKVTNTYIRCTFSLYPMILKSLKFLLLVFTQCMECLQRIHYHLLPNLQVFLVPLGQPWISNRIRL